MDPIALALQFASGAVAADALRRRLSPRLGAALGRAGGWLAGAIGGGIGGEIVARSMGLPPVAIADVGAALAIGAGAAVGGTVVSLLVAALTRALAPRP